ncbi:unnamed protein product [Gordionus sp. m RMFG-2023]|uniref:myb-like protein X isoform X2 n=1 Tax=Gordionus sp. m RMFG-2023 TaxID=3053472 RepID=UPI0030E58305
MCGRTACGKNPKNICELCTYTNSNNKQESPTYIEYGGKFAPSYNKPPQTYNPILINSKHIDPIKAYSELVIIPMYWTLIPSWFKKGSNFKLRTINCRKEGVMLKPMFKNALKHKYRCIVLAEGYYEWQKQPNEKNKQPYFFYFPECGILPNDLAQVKNVGNDREYVWSCPKLLTMAGLFDIHCEEPESKLYSYTILTVPAHQSVSWIHDRMPGIIDGDDNIKMWLDADIPSEKVMHLVEPCGKLHYHPVSALVNNTQNVGQEDIYPVALPNAKSKKIKHELDPSDQGIKRYFNPTPKEGHRRKTTNDTDTSFEPSDISEPGKVYDKTLKSEFDKEESNESTNTKDGEDDAINQANMNKKTNYKKKRAKYDQTPKTLYKSSNKENKKFNDKLTLQYSRNRLQTNANYDGQKDIDDKVSNGKGKNNAGQRNKNVEPVGLQSTDHTKIYEYIEEGSHDSSYSENEVAKKESSSQSNQDLSSSEYDDSKKENISKKIGRRIKYDGKNQSNSRSQTNNKYYRKNKNITNVSGREQLLSSNESEQIDETQNEKENQNKVINKNKNYTKISSMGKKIDHRKYTYSNKQSSVNSKKNLKKEKNLDHSFNSGYNGDKRRRNSIDMTLEESEARVKSVSNNNKRTVHENNVEMNSYDLRVKNDSIGPAKEKTKHLLSKNQDIREDKMTKKRIKSRGVIKRKMIKGGPKSDKKITVYQELVSNDGKRSYNKARRVKKSGKSKSTKNRPKNY